MIQLPLLAEPLWRPGDRLPIATPVGRPVRVVHPHPLLPVAAPSERPLVEPHFVHLRFLPQWGWHLRRLDSVTACGIVYDSRNEPQMLSYRPESRGILSCPDCRRTAGLRD